MVFENEEKFPLLRRRKAGEAEVIDCVWKTVLLWWDPIQEHH